MLGPVALQHNGLEDGIDVFAQLLRDMRSAQVGFIHLVLNQFVRNPSCVQ
jgi:hypothetical protein